MPVSSCQFRVSGFGFRVASFRFWVLGCHFRVSGFRFRVASFGFRVANFGWFGCGVWDCQFGISGERCLHCIDTHETITRSMRNTATRFSHAGSRRMVCRSVLTTVVRSAGMSHTAHYRATSPIRNCLSLTQDCYSRNATTVRELMVPRTDRTTRIPSGVASPVTTNHAAKMSVFVNLRNTGNFKNLHQARRPSVDRRGRQCCNHELHGLVFLWHTLVQDLKLDGSGFEVGSAHGCLVATNNDRLGTKVNLH